MKSKLYIGLPQWNPIKICVRTSMMLFLMLSLSFQIGANPILLANDLNANSTKTAAEITVSGTVTDITGEPLPGVNVIEKGTTNGTSTDFDGNYSLTVSDENAVLQFSYLGFTGQDININGRSEISISLQESTAELDEVVITALGIKREEKALGYAVSEIGNETISEFANPNAVGSIYGKAAGVQVRSNPGGPIAGVNVVIRGNNSITGFNQPLFVVDGIPIDHGDSDFSRWGGNERGNGAGDLNPEDIESMSVLKGANASALYGSKAANGVVIITTKNGKAGRGGIGVDFTSSAIFDEVAYLPDYQNVFGSGFDSEVFRTNDAGEPIYHETWPSFGPRMEGQMLRWWDDELRPYSPQPDNVKDIYETGHTYTNSIALANSNDKITYRFSYTNTTYKGIYPGVRQNRNTYSLNTSTKLSDKLSVDLVANYYDHKTTNRPERLGGLVAYEFPRSSKTELAKQHYKQDGYFNGITGGPQPTNNTVRNYMRNLWNALENQDVDDKSRIVGNLTFNYQIIDNLRARARIGTDFNNTLITIKEATRDPNSTGDAGGRYTVDDRRSQLDYSELLLFYDHQLTEDLTLNLTAGGIITQERFRRTRAQTDGFINPNWFSINNSRNRPNTGGDNRSERERSDALLGIINLSYRNMLYLEITGRNDWSSTLPSNNNSYFYPSISGSFVFTEAINSPSWLNFGKVRASWAETGNDAERYTANKTYIYENYNGVPTNRFESTVPPLDLLPESQIAYEFGVEAKMFNNRLGVDLTYYTNQNKDQIINLGISPSTGSNSLRTNIGQMNNSGIELQLYGTVLQRSNFSWNATVNFARNSNEVVELAAGIDQFPLASQICGCIRNEARVGRPFGEWTAYVYKRDENGNRIVNSDGLYVRDDSELVPIGNSTPDFIGGMLNEFNYKNLSLNVNFDYSIGGDIFSFTNYYGINAGKTKESLKYRGEENGGLPYYEDADGNLIQLPSHSSPAPNGEVVYHDGLILEGVTEEGRPNTILINAFDYYINTFYWNSGFHEEGLFDNSYIKMREISLRYTFGKDLISKIGLQRASISLVGRNLFYIYRNVPNIDAESFLGTSAGEASAFESGLPGASRSFGASLRVSF